MEIGDVVVRSGKLAGRDIDEVRRDGDGMTVTGIEDGKIRCCWFEGAENYEDLFDPSVLEVVSC